ncbi:hypothetical protein MHM84_17095 [Halomonas sp. McH1-25]|uniref:hypothetical protein n=1 Tax=unclassified Halomonas TaxID=2609666 RepID=UPI001EF43AD6|nr:MULTISPECIES: hypothetical protein [unclassified Halomonas]MCG7601488.1 hypothetical protein [Halomonas sp. McH1-25]MCP1344809.1 hypothetical protein [Halomonas sp. FL8]MCP1362948.1 hypothetical protein [Halomonas sp. BBD45]
MSARTGMRGIGLGAALLMMTTTASAGTAMAIERTPRDDQPLVEECRQLAMEHSGHDLEHKEIKDSNLPEYVPGEEFELRVSFLGHGNTFHNVTCQIDEQGEVSYKDATQEGLPSLGS